jgi:hypothetical protein
MMKIRSNVMTNLGIQVIPKGSHTFRIKVKTKGENNRQDKKIYYVKNGYSRHSIQFSIHFIPWDVARGQDAGLIQCVM